VLTFCAAIGVRDDKGLERAEVVIVEPVLDIGMEDAVTRAGEWCSLARDAADRAFLRGFASVPALVPSVFRVPVVLALRSHVFFCSCSVAEVPMAGERVADDVDLFRAEVIPV
jgi:hypothetical protein